MNDRYGPLPLAWWAVIAIAGLGLVFGALNAVWNRKYVFRDGHVAGVIGRMGQGKSLFMVTRVLIPFCRALHSNRGRMQSVTHRPVRRVVCNFEFDPGMRHVEVRTVGPTAGRSLFDSIRALAEELGQTEGPWKHPDTGQWISDERVGLPDVCSMCGESSSVFNPGVNPVLSYDHTTTCRFAHRRPILNGLLVVDEAHLYVSSSKLAMRDNAAWVVSMTRKLNAEFWWVSQSEMKIHKRMRDDSTEFWLAQKLAGPLTALIGSAWHVASSYESVGALARARDNAGTGNVPRSRDRRIYRYTRRAGRLYSSFELIDTDTDDRAARARPDRPTSAPNLPPSVMNGRGVNA